MTGIYFYLYGLRKYKETKPKGHGHGSGRLRKLSHCFW